MEKNKKVFYFDFIRVVSTVIIVTYHFFAHFDENGIKGMRFLSDGKWGMIGVTLFFMLSGASLMYNYGETLDIKKYALKRFLGIYPMFWIAYIGVFTYIFYGCKRIIWDIPKYKILFSLFAMDGYLSPYTQTFYLIGEWFLGCIVFIYILFPFLRKALEKQPVITSVVFTVLNFSAVIFLKNTKMPINKNLIVCSYSFFLGMCVVKYIKKIKWYYAAAALFAVWGGISYSGAKEPQYENSLRKYYRICFVYCACFYRAKYKGRKIYFSCFIARKIFLCGVPCSSLYYYENGKYFSECRPSENRNFGFIYHMLDSDRNFCKAVICHK